MPPEGRSQGLPRARRITRRADFLEIQNGGRKLYGAHYVLFVRSLPMDEPAGAATGIKGPRLGVTVSRKVGNAVVRNRVKRWIRESYRRSPTKGLVFGDVVVVARSSAAKVGFEATQEELETLLKRAVGRPGAGHAGARVRPNKERS